MAIDRPIIVVVGPTAGGKTPLAIELAERLPDGGEIISADSMQVYRGMDIGTAKPTAEDRARVPHHLIDLVSPGDDSFSVDAWLDLAEQAITEIRSRGRWPIVVGGTNLYVKALVEGLFDGPGPDSDLRAELESRETQELRAELERVDPRAAGRIHANDRRRTIRAIEVFRATGVPLSEQQREWDRGRVRADVVIVGLDCPAEVINRRINARVKAMLERGLVEEALGLYESGSVGTQAAEALGYAQLFAHFRGEIELDEAVEQIKIRTRRYAKQQRSWLRRFRAYGCSLWLAADGPEAQTLVEQALTWIRGQSVSG